MTAAELPPGLDRPKPGVIRARYWTAEGKQRSKTWPERGNIREAVRWRRDRMAEVDAGTHPVGDPQRLFAEYAAERVLTWRKHKPSTRAAVEGHLRGHLLPFFGGMTVGSIKPAHVERWVVETEQRLAPATLRVAFAWLNRLMADAARERLIMANPCTGIELPEVPEREVQPVPLDAVGPLAEAMPRHLAATVLVGAWAGLRQGEVLGLRVHRLNLLGSRDERGRVLPPSLYVAEQLQTLKGAPALISPKTKRSIRRVPIPRVLVDGLAAHLAEQVAEPEGFIFRNTFGRPLRRNLFHESWTRAVAEVGLPTGTRFHDLRHSYASLLIEAGESVTVVSKRLGHASATETLDTYSHLWPDSDENTVAVLDAAYDRLSASGVTERSRGGAVTAFPQVSG